MHKFGLVYWFGKLEGVEPSPAETQSAMQPLHLSFQYPVMDLHHQQTANKAAVLLLN